MDGQFVEFLFVERAIPVFISGLEPGYDRCQKCVFINCAIFIRVYSAEFLKRKNSRHLGPVQGAFLLAIQRLEPIDCSLFDLVNAESAIVVSVPLLKERVHFQMLRLSRHGNCPDYNQSSEPDK